MSKNYKSALYEKLGDDVGSWEKQCWGDGKENAKDVDEPSFIAALQVALVSHAARVLGELVTTPGQLATVENRFKSQVERLKEGILIIQANKSVDNGQVFIWASPIRASSNNSASSVQIVIRFHPNSSALRLGASISQFPQIFGFFVIRS